MRKEKKWALCSLWRNLSPFLIQCWVSALKHDDSRLALSFVLTGNCTFCSRKQKNTLNQSGQLVVITFFWWEIKLLAAHFLYRTNSITPGMKMRSVSGHVRLMWPHPELTLCSGVNAIFTTEAGVCTRRDNDTDICRKSNKRLSANIWSYVDSVPLEHQTEDALFCRPCEE